VYQAGTLSGNPLAVSAGLATLSELTPALYGALEERSARLSEGLERAVADLRVKAVVQRAGSMLTLFFHEGPVQNWQHARASDTKRFARFHQALLERGVFWVPAQFEAAFVSAQHSEDDVDRTVEAATEALRVSA
jgi:glutamate-1-semialdehyde 2,1-aminomutase